MFVDNNAVVTEGWLDALLGCAHDTGAAFVAPIYCIGSLDTPVVHTADGEGRIDSVDGRRHLVDVHRHCNRRLDDVRGQLGRKPSEIAEFHCVLARTDVVRDLGGFDPGLPAALEHVDCCLQATQRAGGGWFEPAAVVTYMAPPPLAPSDVPYFSLRWSKTWIDASFAHFADKWELAPDDPGLASNREWLDKYRWRQARPLRGALRRTLGTSAVTATEPLLDRVLSATLVRRARRAPEPRCNVIASGRT